MRFLKVPDAKKLSDILHKLLPNILKIYLENDLHNLGGGGLPEHPKIKTLDELTGHLLMKVTNAKGDVKIPFSRLIDIFHSDEYSLCPNVQVKQHLMNRLFDFVFAAYGHLPAELDHDFPTIFVPILKSLPKLDIVSHEKATLLDMMLHRMLGYFRRKEMKALKARLKEVFETELAGDSGGQAEQIPSSGTASEKKTSPYALELLSSLLTFTSVF